MVLVIDPFQNMLPFHAAPRRSSQRYARTPDYRRGSAFINWFIRSDYVQSFTEGNTSDWVNDSDRAERCQDAAEHGADGSTHHEIITDWRSAARSWFFDRSRDGKEHERMENAVILYLDELECWHDLNGTLWEQVG